MIRRLLRAMAGRRVAAPFELPDRVELRIGAWIPAIGGRLSGMRHAASAVTLGRTIIVHPDVEITQRLLRHELEHVRQWTRQPLLFPVRYVLNHLRYGYWRNPFEIDARTAEHRAGTGTGPS